MGYGGRVPSRSWNQRRRKWRAPDTLCQYRTDTLSQYRTDTLSQYHADTLSQYHQLPQYHIA
eukprot:3940248-Rhodomonas_salina.2